MEIRQYYFGLKAFCLKYVLLPSMKEKATIAITYIAVFAYIFR